MPIELRFGQLRERELAEIGEKGVSLSDGQKARIYMARTDILSIPDIYLFDGPAFLINI